MCSDLGPGLARLKCDSLINESKYKCLMPVNFKINLYLLELIYICLSMSFYWLMADGQGLIGVWDLEARLVF